MAVPFGKYELLRKIASGGMGQVFLARERSAARAAGRAQAHPAAPGRGRRVPQHVPGRGADRGAAAAPEHRQHPRPGRGRRPPLHGHGVRARARTCAGWTSFARAQGRPLPLGLVLPHHRGRRRRAGLRAQGARRRRASRWAGAPGRVAAEHARGLRRRREAHRLRRGEGGRPARSTPPPACSRASTRTCPRSRPTGRPWTARSDVFALGVVLWELLTGQRLFKGETDLMTLRLVTRLPGAAALAAQPQAAAGAGRGGAQGAGAHAGRALPGLRRVPAGARGLHPPAAAAGQQRAPVGVPARAVRGPHRRGGGSGEAGRAGRGRGPGLEDPTPRAATPCCRRQPRSSTPSRVSMASMRSRHSVEALVGPAPMHRQEPTRGTPPMGRPTPERRSPWFPWR